MYIISSICGFDSKLFENNSNTSFVVVVGRFIINYTCVDVRACFQYIAWPFCHFCANSNAKFVGIVFPLGQQWSISDGHVICKVHTPTAATAAGNNSYRPQNFTFRSFASFISFIYFLAAPHHHRRRHHQQQQRLRKKYRISNS